MTMKKNIIFSVLTAAVVIASMLVTGCTKSDIEKARDNYDWNKVQPKILGAYGPTTVMRTYTEEYGVAIRGGSVYTWNAEGADLVPIEGVTYKTNVKFMQMDHPAIITVVETTKGGLKSDPDTFVVKVMPFAVPAIHGPTEVVQTLTKTYTVDPREGSTYKWLVDGATVHPTSDDWKIDVEFDQLPPTDSTAYIGVIETNAEGIHSDDTTTIAVKVLEFCKWNDDTFIGDFKCDEPGYAVYDVTFTADDSVKGRIWEANFWDWANEKIYYDLSMDIEQKVVLPKQEFTADGSDGILHFTVEGEGEYNTCQKKMVVHYMVYDADGNKVDDNVHTYTPKTSKSPLHFKGKKK
jgi:hypothetical protein